MRPLMMRWKLNGTKLTDQQNLMVNVFLDKPMPQAWTFAGAVDRVVKQTGLNEHATKEFLQIVGIAYQTKDLLPIGGWPKNYGPQKRPINYLPELVRIEYGRLLPHLNPRYAEIACLFFGLKGGRTHTIKEIAEHLRVSQSRTRDLVRRISRILSCYRLRPNDIPRKKSIRIVSEQIWTPEQQYAETARHYGGLH